jgi:four helix bundle protein
MFGRRRHHLPTLVMQRFEELVVWQRSRELANAIHAFSIGGSSYRDFVYRDQINRASASVMANIAEGFGRRSHADFARFLDYSRSSLREVQSFLYLGLDYGYIGQEEFDKLYLLCGRIATMLTHLMHSLQPS